MKKINLRSLGVVLFVIGVMTGLVLNIMSVWADFEATMFDASVPAEGTFPGLTCPILIGKDQDGIIKAKITNSTDKPIKPSIRAHVSDGSILLVREFIEKLEIDPGKTANLEWSFTQKDSVWGKFVFFRVYQFPTYPFFSQTAACGVLVANLPGINGTVLTVLLYLVSIAGMGLGIWLWKGSYVSGDKHIKEALAGMVFIALAILAGLVLNLLEMWLLGFFMLIVTILLLVVVLAYLFSLQ